jgi:putative PLP-dependent aminotransferase (TIGR04422 family)
MLKDYQWPSIKKLSEFTSNTNLSDCKKLTSQIESELFRLYKHPLVLLPSARAGLASILEFLNISKQHSVFAPKYSSHCIWDVLGRVTNPTTRMDVDIDVVLAVHKWGFNITSAHSNYPCLIEDSVDSLSCPEALFQLSGQFELFSLPKLIGSYSGGVVLSKNIDYLDWIKEIRFNNIELITNQSYLKHRAAMGVVESMLLPEHNEALNRGLDESALKHIVHCLPNFKINQKIIRDRIRQLNDYFQVELIPYDIKRLPCVFPVNTKVFKCNQPEIFMLRHFDYARRLENSTYAPCWLLPLHFGIKDKIFFKMLRNLEIK